MSHISMFGHSSHQRSTSPRWSHQPKRSLFHIETHRLLMNLILFLIVMLMTTAPISASMRGAPRTPGTNVVYVNPGTEGGSGINPIKHTNLHIAGGSGITPVRRTPNGGSGINPVR